MSVSLATGVSALDPNSPNSKIVKVLYQNWSSFIRTSDGTAGDTSFVLAHRATVGGPEVGPNSCFRISFDFECTTTGTKTFNVKFGGTTIAAPSATGTAINGGYVIYVPNKGVTNFQRVSNRGYNPYTTSTTTETTLGIETTVPFNIDIEVKWSAAATAGVDTITINGLLVELLP